jgi:hypothetical protein
MISSRLLVLTATAFALVVAAPAGALTGYGVAGALHVSTLPTVAPTKPEQKHTCQAKSGSKKSSGSSHALVGTVKKPTVVACEQPPRSEVLTQGLKQAGAAALAALG